MKDKRTIWDDAGIAGIVLGCVSVAYLLISWLVSMSGSSVLLKASNILLWFVKFGGCIWLMRYFMKKYSSNNPGADNGKVFNFGLLVAFLSALIYSGAYLAYSLFIVPDQFDKVFDALRESPMMDSNSLEMLDGLMPKMPTISFFVNLFYCTLYGTILSAILSRNIPSKNPFETESKIDEQ